MDSVCIWAYGSMGIDVCVCVICVSVYAYAYGCVHVICFAVLEAIADDSTEVPQLLSDYLQSEGKLLW